MKRILVGVKRYGMLIAGHDEFVSNYRMLTGRRDQQQAGTKYHTNFRHFHCFQFQAFRNAGISIIF